jgi:hypothetical protein
MNAKIDEAIRMLGAQGHTARTYMHNNKEWFEIDYCMLATPGEMEELANGVYTLDELEELFLKRRAEEQGRARVNKCIAVVRKGLVDIPDDANVAAYLFGFDGSISAKQVRDATAGKSDDHHINLRRNGRELRLDVCSKEELPRPGGFIPVT